MVLILPSNMFLTLQVKKSSKLYAENASEMLNHFVKAFCAQDNTAALDSISEAKSLFKAGAKQLLSIKDKQVSEHQP